MEKPSPADAPSRLVNAGTYIIEKKALEFLPSGFNLIERTLFPRLAAMGKLFCHVHKGMWLTTDTKERLERAEKAILAGRKK